MSREIDLRDVSVSFYSNTGENDPRPLPLAKFRELRTDRMREYGWRDIPESSEDHDRYDDPGVPTTSVVVHRSNGDTVAGARLTLVTADVSDTLSAQMWPQDVSDKVSRNSQLNDLYRDDSLLDMTRLLLGDTGHRQDLIILIGACVAHTNYRFGACFTVTAKVYSYLAFSGLPVEAVHRGEIAGERTVFAMMPPLVKMPSSSRSPIAMLEKGAKMAGEPLRDTKSYSAPTIDLRTPHRSREHSEPNESRVSSD